MPMEYNFTKVIISGPYTDFLEGVTIMDSYLGRKKSTDYFASLDMNWLSVMDSGSIRIIIPCSEAIYV